MCKNFSDRVELKSARNRNLRVLLFDRNTSEYRCTFEQGFNASCSYIYSKRARFYRLFLRRLNVLIYILRTKSHLHRDHIFKFQCKVLPRKRSQLEKFVYEYIQIL